MKKKKKKQNIRSKTTTNNVNTPSQSINTGNMNAYTTSNNALKQPSFQQSSDENENLSPVTIALIILAIISGLVCILMSNIFFLF